MALFGSTKLRMIEHILNGMQKKTGVPMVLTGSTGLGKTTFVEDLGKLFGLNVVTIEAPSIVEEEVINIPFVIITPTGAKSGGVAQLPKDPKIHLAKSYLTTKLETLPAINDTQYLNGINKSPAPIKNLFAELDGNAETIPPEIKTIRSRYKTILFIDEYFRKTTGNIRNCLRTFLDRRIGNDPMPSDVFVLYASNVNDIAGTMDDATLNQVSHHVKFLPPTKEEFLQYMIDRAKRQGHPLDPILIDALDNHLNDSHLSYDDLATDIRTSPRRWEEIIKYINANLPFENEDQIKALNSNIEGMFKNEHGHKSELHRLVNNIIDDLLEISSVPITNTRPNETHEWRDTLAQQLAVKMKLGGYRKYVPIVMGMPGIGKTSQMIQAAAELGLLYITVNCQNINDGDVTGIPLPKKEQETYSTQFSEPPLLQLIKNLAEDTKSKFLADPKVPKEVKTKWESQKYRYLLLFDELNRVSKPEIFNSLRRVILEKKFNDNTVLPSDMVVVAAMNPKDKRIQELTGHMKDAVDLIDAEPTWQGTMDHLKSAFPHFTKYNSDLALKFINEFADTFTIKKTNQSIPQHAFKFYLSIGNTDAWISPRDYTDLYEHIVLSLEQVARKINKYSPSSSEIEALIFSKIWANFEGALSGVLRANDITSETWLNSVHSWLKKNLPKFLGKLTSSKVTLDSMLDKTLQDKDKHLFKDENWPHYMKSYARNKFMEDMKNYFDKLMKQGKNKYDVLMQDVVNMKQSVQDEKSKELRVIISNDLWSKLEAIHKEIVMAAETYNMGDITDALDRAIILTISELASYLDMPDDELLAFNQKAIDKLHRVEWTTK